MTSAGLTASSSASSLTVIVVGSSIAPRSRGSITCTCEFASPGRRGGLRGPRRPRVPLLLLATGSSLCRHHLRSRQEHRAELLGNGRLECAPEGAALGGEGPAAGVPAEVGTPAGQPAGLIHCHLSGGCPDHANQVALGTCRPTGHARPGRDAPRRVRSPPGYEPTSSVVVVAFFVRVFFGAASAGPASSAAGFAVAVAAGFFARLFGAALGSGVGAVPGSIADLAATAVFVARAFFGAASTVVSVALSRALAASAAGAAGVASARTGSAAV